MELRHLTADDVPEAGRVFAVSLGSPPPKEPDRYQRYWDVGTSLGAWDDDGRLLGVAARFPAATFTAVGGARLRCTAVPSVGVRPDAHRRGVGRALLERQVREAADRGDQVLALNASEVGIYGRYGYGPTSTWWSVETDSRMLAWRDDAPRAAVGSIEEVDHETAHGLLPALHERIQTTRAGELSRHDGWWRLAFQPRGDERPADVAVHRGEDGEVDAVARFTVSQHFDEAGFANRLELRDCFGVDAGTEALLLRWLLERSLLGRFTAERLDPRTPLPWMLVDPRRLRTTTAADAVWVRVVDVAGVVAARTTTAGGSVTIALDDPLLAANRRTWRIEGDGQRLTCEPVDTDPDLAFGIDLLAPLLWRHVEVGRLAAAGRLQVRDPGAVAVLDRLLVTTEPSWCSTGF